MISIHKKRCFALVLLVLAIFAAPQAFAHKINLFAYVEADEVYVEGYFVDGKAAQNSKVQVLGPNGDLLLEGITDNQGQFRFPVPQQTDLKIVVNAGMGHQTDFTLSASELSDNESVETVSAKSSGVEISVPQTLNQPAVTSTMNNADLDAVVRKAVNEAIKPLVRELSAAQQKASLSSIVGGVGYIIGFLGLFAFFKARQASTMRPDSDK